RLAWGPSTPVDSRPCFVPTTLARRGHRRARPGEHERSMSRKASPHLKTRHADFGPRTELTTLIASVTLDTKAFYGSDHPALGMAHLWCELWRSGWPLQSARAGPRAGERRSVSALAAHRRQREGARPAHGHQDAGARQHGRPRTVATGDEGDVPIARRGGGQGLRGAGRRAHRRTRRLHA